MLKVACPILSGSWPSLCQERNLSARPEEYAVETIKVAEFIVAMLLLKTPAAAEIYAQDLFWDFCRNRRADI